MSTASPAPRSFALLVPLLLILGLLAAIAYFGLELWKSWHSSASGSTAVLLQAEKTLAGQLRAEKQRLVMLLQEPACKARARLEGRHAATSPAPAGLPAVAAPTAQPDDSPEASGTTMVEQACVFIVSLGRQGAANTGAGFFVAPGYVATNKHVVAGANGKILVTSKSLGQPSMAETVALGQKDRDYAILKAKMPKGKSIRPLHFAPGFRRTDKVGAWGFPHIIGQNDPAYARFFSGHIDAVPELSYTEGVISAVLEREPPLIVHSAPLSPGNSGGPLVNAKGEIVGINTMITLDDGSYRQASIALAGDDLLRFLRERGIAAPSGRQSAGAGGQR